MAARKPGPKSDKNARGKGPRRISEKPPAINPSTFSKPPFARGENIDPDCLMKYHKESTSQNYKLLRQNRAESRQSVFFKENWKLPCGNLEDVKTLINRGDILPVLFKGFGKSFLSQFFRNSEMCSAFVITSLRSFIGDQI